MTTATQIRKEIKKTFARHFAVQTLRDCENGEFYVSNGDGVDMKEVAETLQTKGFEVKYGLPYCMNKNCFYVK